MKAGDAWVTVTPMPAPRNPKLPWRLRLDARFSLLFLLGLLFHVGPAAAQAPATEGAAPPLLPLEAQGQVVVPADSPPSIAAPEAAPMLGVEALTQKLIALEARTLELEMQRDAIRTRGPRIGKIVSWTMAALFLGSAFSWFGRAQAVDEALKDGRTDKAYDVNGNGKVTQHDEDVARRVARTFAVTSLIPIGLGVFSTLLEVRRNREKHRLTHEIEDIARERRNVLRQLEPQVSAGKGHASLALKLSF